MDWNLAGAVILSGLVIVFAILCILIGVVALTGKLSGTSAGRKAQVPPSSTPVAAKPAPQTAAPAVQSGISDETVAVITAAVAAVMEEQSPGAAYAVAGIQRARSARPVWGFAGMQQNTRPF